METHFVRVFRTTTSERFLLQQAEGVDAAALDLHYLANGAVTGTLIIYDDAGIQDDGVPAILKSIDERLLPEVSLEEHNLSFTVVIGRVVGRFVPEQDA